MRASNMSTYNIVDINMRTYKMCKLIWFVHNDCFEYRTMISFSSLKYIFDLFLQYYFKAVKKGVRSTQKNTNHPIYKNFAQD